jgi:putative PEP-CTERM system histidine kinase
MAETLILWSHAVAALLFTALALWAAQSRTVALPRWPFVAALTGTAIWTLSVAGIGHSAPATEVALGLCNLTLLGLMFVLHRAHGRRAPVGVITVYGVVALVSVASAVLAVAARMVTDGPGGATVLTTAALLAMMIAVAALVLLQHLDAGYDRGDIRLLALGLAVIWLAQLSIATTVYLAGARPLELLVVRGLVLVLAAALIGAALLREGRGRVHVSRTVAYQSLSLVAVGGYFAVLAGVTSALGAIGGEGARIWQTAFVFGSAAAVLTLVSSPWLRAWTKVKVAKHLFRHRYDYRSEWIRFTGTLGKPDKAAPLTERIIKAVADLTDSPAGLLLVPEGRGLGIGTGWNWTGELPRGGGDDHFVRHLETGERIVELDSVRRGIDAETIPQWLIDEGDAWAVVPLIHLNLLVGAMVLARPPVDRALDWEDFDLLRIAGRQVASYLAEARAQDALAETERFDEFSRRFAFIVHDIKNLVSGLSLVARNAERHADNPEFRADMVATLQDSAAKLNGLLARLSTNHRADAAPVMPIDSLGLIERIALARRAHHPVVVAGRPGIIALADPARLEQILGHLVQNAIDASDPVEPVTIQVDSGRVDGAEVVAIAVIDRGCGMAPAFVREQLFRPFVSSKPGGFGIGAYEARQLAEAMRGRIEVDSREGEGTTFRVILPAASGAAQVAA